MSQDPLTAGVNEFVDTKSQPFIQIDLKVHNYLLKPYCDLFLNDSHN